MASRKKKPSDSDSSHAPRQLLDALWPDDVPSGCVISVFGLQAGAVAGVEFCTTVAEAASWLTERDQLGVDVYVQGAAISAVRAAELRAAPKMPRGQSSDVVAVPGFYVDLDVGPGKFRTQQDAVDFALETMPIRPTMVVGSGGGCHAWYLLREVYEIESAQDRARAEARTHGWSLVARQLAAAECAARVDCLWDMARIGRVPGTTNRKGGRARPCLVLYEGGPRINFSELDDFAVEPTRATAGQTATIEKLGPIVIDPDADVKKARFDTLYVNVEAFAKTWDHERKDLKDQSNSGYDMALATMAAMAGWSPQEIADLVVAHRRKWASSASGSHRRDPLKTRNLGYYLSTVARAVEAAERAGMAERDAQLQEAEAEALEELRDIPDDELLSDQFAAEQARRRVREFFRRHLKIDLDMVERVGDHDAIWRARIRGFRRSPMFTSFREVASWNEWSLRVMEEGIVVADKPPKGWRAAVAAASRVLKVEVEDSGPGSALREWLCEELWASAGTTQRTDPPGGGRHGGDVVKARTAALRMWGWVREGQQVVVSVGKFLARYGDNPVIRPIHSRRAFVDMLRSIGAEPDVVRVAEGTVRIYRLEVPTDGVLEGEQEGDDE